MNRPHRLYNTCRKEENTKEAEGKALERISSGVWGLLLAFALFLSLPSLLDASREFPGEAPETLRAKMTINENEAMWNFWTVERDVAKVQKVLKERNVKLPLDLSPKALIAMTIDSDEVIMVFDKSADGKEIRVTVDSNQDNNLADEKSFEIPAEESGSKPPIQFRIQRFLGPDKSRSVSRPYYIIYSLSKDKNGQPEDHYGYAGHYCAEGTLDAGDKPLKIRMWDLLADGKFDRRDLVQGSAISLDINGDGEFKGREEFFMGHELFSLAGTYYKIEEVAEDGSEILFKRTDLQPAELDRPAPDFELKDTHGKLFWLKDYRGRILLLDFWPSWCKPCIENFPEIKDMVKKFQGKSFDIVGINLDDAERLGNAFKIIEKYGLDWRHVADGKGYFQPIWQVYGVLPERRMAFPLYVVIDAEGLVRAGTNDLAKAEQVLNGLLLR